MNDYIELSIELTPFHPWADLVSQDLSELGFDSFEQEEPKLLAYISEKLFEKEKIESLMLQYGDSFTYMIDQKVIPAKNWNETWEANFESIVIADRIHIRATFHKKRPESEFEILLTPKMAFGTGHHATTALMMEEMLSLDFKGQKVLDVGSGTAILSILAEQLGAHEILAIDNDDWAVLNALENSEINNCEKIIVEKAEVDSLGESAFNVILANINRNVILNDFSKYGSLLIPGGDILLSGFHIEDAPLIESKAKSLRLKKVNFLSRDNWCMIHFN